MTRAVDKPRPCEEKLKACTAGTPEQDGNWYRVSGGSGSVREGTLEKRVLRTVGKVAASSESATATAVSSKINEKRNSVGPTLGRLFEKGLVERRVIPTGTPNRWVYRLTDAGESELQ